MATLSNGLLFAKRFSAGRLATPVPAQRLDSFDWLERGAPFLTHPNLRWPALFQSIQSVTVSCPLGGCKIINGGREGCYLAGPPWEGWDALRPDFH